MTLLARQAERTICFSRLEEFDELERKCEIVDVMGFSMGGALATYLSQVRKINKLILIAPANYYFNPKALITNTLYAYHIFKKIGKSIELCGGTHASNTNEISRLAITSCESKGSNVYRIEAVTNNKVETALFDVIKPYNDEKIKLLMKAKEIIEDAKNEGIKLVFDIDINHDKPTSYKDIMYEKNELQYVQQEVRDLEKKYFEAREKKTLENLDIYREKVKDYNGLLAIVMEVNNKDTNLLKTIADTLVNEMGEGFVFFANKKDDGSVNFLARSTSRVHAGLIVKDASVSSNGNGGGSPTFAQGGGKDQKMLKEIFEHVEKVLRNE